MDTRFPQCIRTTAHIDNVGHCYYDEKMKSRGMTCNMFISFVLIFIYESLIVLDEMNCSNIHVRILSTTDFHNRLGTIHVYKSSPELGDDKKE